ncbi:O-antigen ligase family protein [Rhizobium binxianense]|uniref:O-antigen ligase family protein n=1 Tax=Rhizobium binxianense TaxID=3024242 RepID=UPI00235F3CDE|nr:O-antigen ligase family protein [Rhizobium sp. MJ37]MDC9837964.1 O-antigen ligase family protein [Rhizobium sp. MJ37]
MSAAPQKAVSPFRLSLRELALVIIITFPVIGTLFPLDSYLGGTALGSLAGLVPKTPLNTTLILALILGYVFYLFSRNPEKSVYALRRNWLLFIFLLWCFITSRWAADPGGSFNRTGRMLVFTLYAVYLIEFVPYRRALQLLAICLAMSCFLSLIMIAALPSLSYSAADLRGAWRGAMMHKNVLGGTAATTFLVALAAWRLRLFKPYQTFGLGILAVFLLMLANSATALLTIVLLTAVLAYLLFVVNRVAHPLMLLFATAVAAAGAGAIIISSDLIFVLLGRDSSLTGRAEVWEFVSMMIQDKPFWGYGNGIWTADYFKDLVMHYLHWPAPHAHNAWLDFRLQLGMPGLILAIAIWSTIGLRIIYAVAIRRVPEMALAIAIFLSQSIRSYSETVVVDPALNEMFWLAFAYAAFAALPVRERLRRRQQKQQTNRMQRSRSTTLERFTF